MLALRGQWSAVCRYALRNTLVAKDLEQASRIAYGTRDRRFARVVTQAGQLIAGEVLGRPLLLSLCSAAPSSSSAAEFSKLTVLAQEQHYDTTHCIRCLALRLSLQKRAPCLVVVAGPVEG